jgi:hypothetical protein
LQRDQQAVLAAQIPSFSLDLPPPSSFDLPPPNTTEGHPADDAFGDAMDTSDTNAFGRKVQEAHDIIEQAKRDPSSVATNLLDAANALIASVSSSGDNSGNQ